MAASQGWWDFGCLGFPGTGIKVYVSGMVFVVAHAGNVLYRRLGACVPPGKPTASASFTARPATCLKVCSEADESWLDFLGSYGSGSLHRDFERITVSGLPARDTARYQRALRGIISSWVGVVSGKLC
jgi:hypothetical protein